MYPDRDDVIVRDVGLEGSCRVLCSHSQSYDWRSELEGIALIAPNAAVK